MQTWSEITAIIDDDESRTFYVSSYCGGAATTCDIQHASTHNSMLGKIIFFSKHLKAGDMWISYYPLCANSLNVAI